MHVDPPLHRRFEAVIFDWEGTAVPGAGADASQVRGLVEALSLAAVEVAILSSGSRGELDRQLGARRTGRGHLYLCPDDGAEVVEVTADGLRPVGVSPGSPGAAVRWLLADLDARGVGPGLVLIVGHALGSHALAHGLVEDPADSDARMLVPEAARAVVASVGEEPHGVPQGVEHLGGGPEALVALLRSLLEQRPRQVPDVDLDPGWVVVRDEGNAADSAVLTVSEAGMGTPGGLDEESEGVLVAGVYEGEGPNQRLLRGPRWTQLGLPPRTPAGWRILDLRSGVLRRETATAQGQPIRSARFLVAGRPGVGALRADGPDDVLSADPVRVPEDAPVTAAVAQTERTYDGRRVVERVVGLATDWDDARRRLQEASAVGFDGLLADHRETWARRWQDVDVTIDGDPDVELGARFSLFHLIGGAPSTGEAAVGARGVSGDGYLGHVFWDTDIYVLPTLAAVSPAAARAVLEYRLRRLPAARAAAAARGLPGARFPWESARDGNDVTPSEVTLPNGQVVPCLTGEQEEHVVADVAWAADFYARWTGDQEFLRGPGRELIVETARYWAARATVEPDGTAHIRGVIGPDEYHESVDDNAYTNVMARWNLRRAADLVEAESGSTSQTRGWRDVADRLVDGIDRRTLLQEQFAGFHGLLPLVVTQVATPPVVADVELGWELVHASQVVKQADVLLLHHLVPGELPVGSLPPNLDYYLPRTAHGSSLSPAVTAALLARAGRPDEAVPLLRLAARIDLDDVVGVTSGGLHVATMGGLWQALAFGIAGLRAMDDALLVDPRLPSSWRRLALRLWFRSRPIGVEIRHDAVELTTQGPLRVLVGGHESVVDGRAELPLSG